MNNLKNLKTQIINSGVVLLFIIAVTIIVYKSKQYNKLKQETTQKLYSTEQLHQIEIDSMKLRIVQDSLYIVDLQRLKQINNLNTQDRYDKAKHDLIISIIPTTDDKERDKLWATYSPKN